MPELALLGGLPVRAAPYPRYPVLGDEAERPLYEEGMCPLTEDLCDRMVVEVKVHPTSGLADMADVAAFKKVVACIHELRAGAAVGGRV
jgi:hypothetical protein